MLRLRQLTAYGLLAASLSGCATILGGPITAYQRTKPLPGQPQREVRVGALIADVLLVGALGVVIDFATGAIYKPAPRIPVTNATPPPPPGPVTQPPGGTLSTPAAPR